MAQGIKGSHPPCSVDGCPKKAKSRLLCDAHYQRLRRFGSPTAGGPIQIRRDDLARFEAKVDRDGPLPTWAPFLGPCWIWSGQHCSSGYSRFYLGDGFVQAHRYSYEQSVGAIPEGLQLDHLCRVPGCVNPAHLEPVTPAENQERAIQARGLVGVVALASVREFGEACAALARASRTGR